MATNAHSSSTSSFNYTSEPSDALKCMICLEVAKNPLQHEACGKLFCKKCIENHGRYKPCPNCRTSGSQFYVDKKSKKEIEALPVKCNVDRECEWEGTVGTLEAHVATCEFTPCPKCSKKMLCQDIEKHVELECEHTVIPCKFKNIGCTTEMKRGDVEAHEQDDSLHLKMSLGTVVKLQDANTELLTRVAQLESSVPSSSTFQFTGYKSVIEFISPPFYRSPVEFTSPPFYTSPGGYNMAICVHGHSNEYFDFMYSDLKKSIEKDTDYAAADDDDDDEEYEEVDSDSDDSAEDYSDDDSEIGDLCEEKQCGDRDCENSADGADYELDEDDHLSVFIIIKKGVNDDSLKWPFVGTISISLLNQLEDKNHYLEVLTIPSQWNVVRRSDKKWGYVKFSHSKLAHDPIKNTQYLKDDTLYFKVSVDTPNIAPWLVCTAK